MESEAHGKGRTEKERRKEIFRRLLAPYFGAGLLLVVALCREHIEERKSERARMRKIKRDEWRAMARCCHAKEREREK